MCVCACAWVRVSVDARSCVLALAAWSIFGRSCVLSVVFGALSASGTVYLANDTRTGQQVAIKMSSANELENLKHEIALQSLSRHENIVRYIETYMHQRHLWVRRATSIGRCGVLLTPVRVQFSRSCWSLCMGALLQMSWVQVCDSQSLVSRTCVCVVPDDSSLASGVVGAV